MSNPEPPSLNQKLKTLEENVEWFYSDDFSLDSSLEKYKATLALAEEIETDLKSLKNEVKVLGNDFTKE